MKRQEAMALNKLSWDKKIFGLMVLFLHGLPSTLSAQPAEGLVADYKLDDKAAYELVVNSFEKQELLYRYYPLNVILDAVYHTRDYKGFLLGNGEPYFFRLIRQFDEEKSRHPDWELVDYLDSISERHSSEFETFIREESDYFFEVLNCQNTFSLDILKTFIYEKIDRRASSCYREQMNLPPRKRQGGKTQTYLQYCNAEGVYGTFFEYQDQIDSFWNADCLAEMEGEGD